MYPFRMQTYICQGLDIKFSLLIYKKDRRGAAQRFALYIQFSGNLMKLTSIPF